MVEESVGLGIVEAVVTGGEPFMRRELTLAMLERLTAAGVGVSLNTNGWFVDEEIADRLAGLAGLLVHVSVDAAKPESHDRARGVPGSWRRAVRAIDLLLTRGVRVQAVHVVTPANVGEIGSFLEHMWLLGAQGVRLSPVTSIGGAATGDWSVEPAEIGRAAAAFAAVRGTDFRVLALSADGLSGDRLGGAPRSLLVRPNGAVLRDSLHPFSFADVRELTLEECWARVVAGANDSRVERWRRGGIPAAVSAADGLVPYRDPEVEIEPSVQRADTHEARDRRRHPALVKRVGHALRRRLGRSLRTRGRIPPGNTPGGPEIAGAREHIVGLALDRQYRHPALRILAQGDVGECLVRVVGTEGVHRLNATAATVLQAIDCGSAGAAVESLAERHPDVIREQLEEDTLAAVRWLLARKMIIPAARDRDEAAVPLLARTA